MFDKTFTKDYWYVVDDKAFFKNVILTLNKLKVIVFIAQFNRPLFILFSSMTPDR